MDNSASNRASNGNLNDLKLLAREDIPIEHELPPAKHGRDEVREAVTTIVRFWDHSQAKLGLALEQLGNAADYIGANPYSDLPPHYRHQPWSFDYDEQRKIFFVHCGGHRICDSEDSEVAAAICKSFNERFRISSR